MKQNKKGVLAELSGLAVGIATLAIVLVVAFMIMSQGKDQIGDIEGLAMDPTTGKMNATQCYFSAACNSTATLQNATSTIPGWVPLIVIAMIGAVLLGLVAMFRKR